MSSSEGEVISECKKTFFSTQPDFPELTDDKIDTSKFLDASRGVVELIERMGKGFTVVKHDVLGNIEKLHKRYLTNPKKFSSLTDMVLQDHSEGRKDTKDALLWLKRALNFVQVFLGYFIEDFHESNSNGELTVFLKKAYHNTLRPYHGWITQKLFLVVVAVCPSKRQMFLLLALGEDDLDPRIIIEDMEIFVNNLSANLKVIDEFYLDNNLD